MGQLVVFPGGEDREERWVGQAEIARRLGRTQRTVRRWTRERGLPVAGPAGAPLYSPRSVDAWLVSIGSEVRVSRPVRQAR